MQNLFNTPPADETPTIPTRSATLYHHFFRRFFDNDTLALNGGVEAGETQTTVVRALAAVAVPGLMFAFWLSPRYPGRPIWATESDRYFFVLFSFVVMGAATTFEWEMLFPDRSDFLILLTLPLKARELFYAKGRALLTFLAMFLIGSNLFAAVLFPAFSAPRFGSFFHSVWPHVISVALCGIFSSFTILSMEGLVLCLLPSRWFRPVSTAIQSLAITALVLLFLLYPLIGAYLQPLMEGRAPIAQWIPPLWFLGLNEVLLEGNSAPAAAQSLAVIGLCATAAVAAFAILTYPLAWSRQQKRALEGASQRNKPSRQTLTHFLHRTLIQQPQHRAIFHFLSQTLTRNPRYQVYLALYAGVGMALALCSILTLQPTANHTLIVALWQPGLHALLPLLLFWMVTGLRAAFSFPVDMRSNWVFPITLRLPLQQSGPNPYAFPGPAAKSAKLWTLLCCTLLTAAILAILLALHWSYSSLLIQAIFGAGLSIFLADLFFLGRTQIPFARPRMPGRTNLAVVFLLYTAIFPAVVLSTVHWELLTEAHPLLLLWTTLTIAALHLLLRTIDHLAQKGIIGGFPEDETDQGPQTLDLTQ